MKSLLLLTLLIFTQPATETSAYSAPFVVGQITEYTIPISDTHQ